LPFGNQRVEAALQIGRDAGVNLKEQRSLILDEMGRGALGAQGNNLACNRVRWVPSRLT
jgi:hypothetical protein